MWLQSEVLLSEITEALYLATQNSDLEGWKSSPSLATNSKTKNPVQTNKLEYSCVINIEYSSP